MIAVSGSMAMPSRSTLSVPVCGAPAGSKRSQLNSRWSVLPASTAGRTRNTATMAIAPIDSSADSIWLDRVTKTITTNASSGSTRIVSALKTIGAGSAFHQVELIYLDRAPLAVDRDDDRQPDGRLRGGLGDDEDGEELSSEFLLGGDVAGEGHHQQVDPVEHQLDAEQDADGVAT